MLCAWRQNTEFVLPMLCSDHDHHGIMNLCIMFSIPVLLLQKWSVGQIASEQENNTFSFLFVFSIRWWHSCRLTAVWFSFRRTPRRRWSLLCRTTRAPFGSKTRRVNTKMYRRFLTGPKKATSPTLKMLLRQNFPFPPLKQPMESTQTQLKLTFLILLSPVTRINKLHLNRPIQLIWNNYLIYY